MNRASNTKLTKIGVFYDGNYFLHVSNYYNYIHDSKRRLSIAGLHKFIRNQVAEEEGQKESLCRIVDAHYFRGRLNAQEASQRGNQLYYDRVFDDILMSEGVITHYLPMKNHFGRRDDKNIDVWLALEAFELAQLKAFDVLVLIASDGDYVPLVRKLNSLGTRVMIVSWDFSFTNDDGRETVTRTSQDLIEEASYPIAMHELIESGLDKNDSLVVNIFVNTDHSQPKRMADHKTDSTEELEEGQDGTSHVFSLKNGYGFISYPPNNLFFHYTEVVEGDFNELQEGDTVEFIIEKNEKGQEVAKQVKKVGHTEGVETAVDHEEDDSSDDEYETVDAFDDEFSYGEDSQTNYLND